MYQEQSYIRTIYIIMTIFLYFWIKNLVNFTETINVEFVISYQVRIKAEPGSATGYRVTAHAKNAAVCNIYVIAIGNVMNFFNISW